MSINHLTVLFLIFFLAVSWVLSSAAIYRAYEDTMFRQKGGGLNGQWAEAFENRFDEEVPHRDFSTRVWGTLTYLFFKEGREGVLAGRNGWLFTSEEFEQGPDYAGNLSEHIDYIKEIRDQLSARGIKLLVIAVPSKARLMLDDTGRYQVPVQKDNAYTYFLRQLRHRKIESVSLYEAFKGSPARYYYKTDTHWNETGARKAALEISAHVSKIWPGLTFERTVFKQEAGRERLFEGDLMRFLPLFGTRSLFGYEKERYIERTTRPENISGNLFGDPAVPVALVGTSYSADEKWHFDGFLKQSFQADVLNFSDEGLGPFQVMENYLKDASFEQTPPKLVIWEIPERYLGQ